jgi:catechol 2,3-dioxygenase-like lactoylglutathione lyase family enzyme
MVPTSTGKHREPADHGRLAIPPTQSKELYMATSQPISDTPVRTSKMPGVDMKLEVVVIPVSDVDRAKRFYESLGWRLDGDFIVGDDFRGVQLTPPGSQCSIHIGKGLTSAAPGSAPGLYLVVSDIEAARAALVARGVDVSEVFHRAGPGKPPQPGREPGRHSYASFVSFKDPDGNSWLVQEVTARLPGRVDGDDTTFASSRDLATALERAAMAHGEHEKRTGQHDANWPAWYAEYLTKEQAGKPLPS